MITTKITNVNCVVNVSPNLNKEFLVLPKHQVNLDVSSKGKITQNGKEMRQ